jgi:quinol monooxygenase YgiN
MPKLAIIGNLEIAPGRLDRVSPLLMAHGARCLADEPGTLQFEVLLPRDDQTKVLLYEVYSDDAAYEAHWNGPSTNRLREETAGMIVGITGTMCAPADWAISVEESGAEGWSTTLDAEVAVTPGRRGDKGSG